MNARQHLAAVIAAISNWVDAGASDEATIQAVHAARNFLAVRELEPKAFQQLLCQRLKSRANAQHLPVKGVKRERAYIEGLMGAGMALEVLGSDQLNPFLILATLGTIRGAVEAVNAVAEGRELP